MRKKTSFLIYPLLIMGVFLVLVSSCKKDKDEDKDTIVPALTVGDSHQGGIIAHIFTQNDPGYVAGEVHGLIAAPYDQSTGAAWGCEGTLIGANAIFGTTNTTAIVNGCAQAGIAARICNDLELNGYSDWYLPSLDELNKLHNNRDIVGGFANDSYWSSTEIDLSHAEFKGFPTPPMYHYHEKFRSKRVRAVRRF